MINKQKFKLKKDGTPRGNCLCRTPELIENYDKAIADTTQTWDCHHRLETHNSDGERRLVDLKAKELIALDMYYNRPPEELIFLTSEEHLRLHNTGNKERGRKVSDTMRGHIVSKETKRKMSEANKGRPHSEEWNRRVSEAMKGHPVSDETKKKISEAMKGNQNQKKRKEGWEERNTVPVQRKQKENCQRL